MSVFSCRRETLGTLCGCWSGRDSWERTQQEALADRTGASSRGRSVGRMAAGGRRRRQAGSGKARNRASARSNWAPQGQRCGRCRVRRRAERVIRLARPKNRRRRVLVVTTCSPRPIRAVQRAMLWAHHLYRQPSAVGGETAGRHVVQPDAVLEVSDGILDLGVAAMTGLQFEQLPVPVGVDSDCCRRRRGPAGNRAWASHAGLSTAPRYWAIGQSLDLLRSEPPGGLYP